MDWTSKENRKLLKAVLTKAKVALRITTDIFDAEIEDIIMAAYDDLGISGVLADEKASSPLTLRAVVTYARYHFGEPEDPAKLKASYDEQKAQLRTADGYTDWEED